MKYHLRKALALAFTTLLAGCSSLGLKIANTPSYFFGGDITQDIIFNEEHQLGLDIYQPKEHDSQKPLQVIVFFYGGRWSYGDKSEYRFVGTALAKEGFLVVIPDYRKYPQVLFPEFIHDGADALVWVRQNISQFNGNSNNIIISGHSAGAHTGALLVSNPIYLNTAGNQGTEGIAGFAGIAGPYTFIPDADDLKEIFGPESNYPNMQIPTFISGHEPPMLLLIGEDDTTVEEHNSNLLTDKIQEKNGLVRTISYPDVDHIEIVGAFSKFWTYKASVIEDVATFARRHSNTGEHKNVSENEQ